MSATDKNVQTDQDFDEAHYHVIGGGTQFVVLRHRHAWHPPTDVMAEENRLIVIVEVAGMKDGEFRVALANQQLTITGSRSARMETHAAYHQLEVRYGEFRTDVVLPWPVDEDKIFAIYEDGMLRVELPRVRSKQILVVDVQKVDSAV
jgi:HSP20 family protein